MRKEINISQRMKIGKINDHIWLFSDKDKTAGYLVASVPKALPV